MQNTNFGRVDKFSLEQNFKKALEDEKFKALATKLNLPASELMKHTTKLEESTAELKNCANCKNSAFCKNKIKGFVYYPEVQNCRVKFDYVACKSTKKRLKEEETSCSYYEMPASLKRAAMKDVDIEDSKRVKVIKWIKNFYDTYPDNPTQKGLYLHGSFGSGKTYLLCAMFNELSKKNVDIVIVYYPELLRSLKDSFDTGDFGSRVNRLKKASILFLDDIGAEAVTPWARDEILGTIVQYRMDAELPTFFTSNLTIDELETHLSSTKSGVELVKARRIIERIKQLTDNLELVSKNRRN